MASYQRGKVMCAGLQGSNQGFSSRNRTITNQSSRNATIISSLFILLSDIFKNTQWRKVLLLEWNDYKSQCSDDVGISSFSSQIRNHLAMNAIPDWFSFSDICSLSWFRSVCREREHCYIYVKVFCKCRFLWTSILQRQIFREKSIQLSAKADFYEKVLSKGRFLWKKYSAMADFSEENKSILQKNFSNGRFLWRKKYLAKADFSEKKYLQRQISLEKIFGKGRFIWRQFFC